MIKKPSILIKIMIKIIITIIIIPFI